MGATNADVMGVHHLFRRQWYCRMRASGYLAEACDQHNPHAPNVKCGYRWIAPPLTDEEARRWLGPHSHAAFIWDQHDEGEHAYCQDDCKEK